MKSFFTVSLLLLGTNFHLFAQTYTTPKGTNINGYVATSSLTPAQLQAIDQDVDEDFDNIDIIEASTNDYNCHGWAWLYSEGGAKIWINTPGDDAFWNDNSYYSTSSTSGEKISYPSGGDHSAIQSGDAGWFISKWGPGPRVKHTPYNVPAPYLDYGTTLTYYNCNFAPQALTAQIDYGTTYNLPYVPASNGSHFMSVTASYAPSYSFTALDPTISISSSSGSTLNFSFSGSSGRINATVTNSCTSTSSYIIIYRPNYRLSAYPNPSERDVTVKFGGDSNGITSPIIKTPQVKSIFVYDDRNNFVTEIKDIKADDSPLKLDTSNLKAGYYFIKAVYEDNTSETKKVRIGVF